MKEAFGGLSSDWKEGINWAKVRAYRLNRAREAMQRHGLGALVLMYDENMRYVSATYTPGWNRMKPGLRYVVLCEGKEPIVYEQGDIGIHLREHSPWIPPENIRYSYSWIKGAVGPAATQQVNKFAGALVGDLEDAGVRDRPVGVDFIDINMLRAFERAGVHWADGMTPMMEARAIKGPDEQKAARIVGSICDSLHYEYTQFLKPGLTENEIAAFGFEYLYSIPGIEDVEDVIVSSGPNAWPNWRNFSDRRVRPGELVIIDLAALSCRRLPVARAVPPPCRRPRTWEEGRRVSPAGAVSRETRSAGSATSRRTRRGPAGPGRGHILVCERPLASLAPLLFGAGGVVCQSGPGDSHLAGVARALGIPMLVQVRIGGIISPLASINEGNGWLAVISGRQAELAVVPAESGEPLDSSGAFRAFLASAARSA